MNWSDTTDCAERAASEFIEGAVSAEAACPVMTTALRLTVDSDCAKQGAAAKRMATARETFRTLDLRRGFWIVLDMMC